MREVSLYAGMPEGREDLGSAVQVVVSVIAAELPTLDRDALARLLPFDLLAREPWASPDVFAAVARALHLPLGPAIELTEAVLRVLGTSVAPTLPQRLEKHLPANLVSHFLGRPPTVPPLRSALRVPEEPPPRRTLSSGRLGSEHPLSASAPHPAHQHSVAENPSPHDDTKLSGARR